MTDSEMYDELIHKMKVYHPSKDFSLVEKAYLLAKTAHQDQFRESGEPYIVHPLAVANILADLELDMESIIAGILHDVIEDTVYSFDDIANLFSEEVAQIVNGVTKIEAIEFSSREEKQAENLRNMFLAMAKDIRVILLKIADRLHNMRTLKFTAPEKQKRVAQETLDIYAPLAQRLGISKLRYEIEDLSFRYLYPEDYMDLKSKIQKKQSERIAYVENIVEDVRTKLKEHGINCVVEGRPKHFFSIYKKMVQQDKSLDELYDIFAIRVIVDSVMSCYEVLGIVHEMYTPVQGRFKDYIALPKPNNYQSLHNTLIGPGGEYFEIQIRTHEMHRIAEYGIAAHWKYKQRQSGETTKHDQDEKLSWLRQILEWQRDLSDNREYLAAIKNDFNIFKDHVYCFTPKGEVIALINGSTVIDFAYAIHSAVGNRMIGAKVDNRIVTIDYVISNGEKIEILTSQNSKGPSRDWLKIVKSSQAKNKINQWFKKESREEDIARGKEQLEAAAKKFGMNLSEIMTPATMASCVNRFSLPDWDGICAAVGHGNIRERQILNRMQEEYFRIAGDGKTDETVLLEMSRQAEVTDRPKNRKNTSGVVVRGVGDISVRFSLCCSPVPGDEIVGFVTRGRGLSIHRTDCSNILHLPDLDKHRLIEAEWHIPEKPEAGVSFRADLHLICDDRKGLLVDVSKIFDSEKTDVISVNLRPAKTGAFFDVSILISSKEQLEKIKARLLKVPGILGIERIST